MADIVVYGTVAADIVLRVPTQPEPGDHIRAEPLGWRLGGSSANVACALAAVGHSVELIGVVGTDELADGLLAELHARGVATGRCVRVDGRSPRALILLDPTGERTILGLDIGSVTEALPLLEPPAAGAAACIYIESYRRYPTSLAEASPGAMVVATPPPTATERWPADVIVGSERQYPNSWRRAVFTRARRLAGSRLRWVVVTRGAHGADAIGEAESLHVDARPARQIDATGAGDAFAAALIDALLAGRTMREALGAGAEAGAAAVEVLGSVPPKWIDGARMA